MTNFSCFCCKGEISTIVDISPNVYDGMGVRISAGYGSKYEGLFGWIFICDGCIEVNSDAIYVTTKKVNKGEKNEGHDYSNR